MKIYIDLLIIINFFFDLTILTCVDVLLKRNTTFKRIVLASLIGEISIVSIIYKIGFTLVLVLSILMSIIAFKYKNIKYTIINVLYFYLVCTLLGGFIYFLTNQFQIDLVYSLRYLLIIVFSPLVLVGYYLLAKNIKDTYNNLYHIKIEYDKYVFNGNGFLDSGNTLTFNGKKVVLIEKKYIQYQRLKLLPIIYNSLNYTGIVFCFKPKSCFINNKEYTDVLIGLSDKSFNIDGAEVLLNAKLGGL